MALIHCNWRADSLGLACSFDALVPEQAAGPHKVLYLLHGMSDDHTIWQRRTAVERYVEPLPLVVIMPAADRSFYVDMARGPRYGTMLAEELPRVVANLFHVSAAREDTFVAGLSMGGYGAFKLALDHPERFAAAASFSGAVDMGFRLNGGDAGWLREMEGIFGPAAEFSGGPHDLLALATRLAATDQLPPRLYQWCGTDDFLIEHNRNFVAHARKLGLPVDYSEGAGGHTWDRWDDQLRRFLVWLGFAPAL